MSKEVKETKFEDNIKELEQIINELESGNVDLDASIEKYTKAMNFSLNIYYISFFFKKCSKFLFIYF